MNRVGRAGKQLRCLRCRYEWERRKPTTPVACPACQSAYWNKPRTFKSGFVAAGRIRQKRGKPVREWGAGSLNSQGYVVLTRNGHGVKEHREVMGRKLGRKLLNTETVHHKNGDRTDNRPKNLELWNRAQPAGQRVIDLQRFAEEILALYGPSKK